MDERNRLYRSTTDRKIAGVCGGLAEYFEVDPVLVRGIFVALAIAGGVGVVLYAVLWMVVPKRAGQANTADGDATESFGAGGDLVAQP
jgi:phage shock protein PspC (stress-responsive transcriptional regulator)